MCLFYFILFLTPHYNAHLSRIEQGNIIQQSIMTLNFQANHATRQQRKEPRASAWTWRIALRTSRSCRNTAHPLANSSAVPSATTRTPIRSSAVLWVEMELRHLRRLFSLRRLHLSRRTTSRGLTGRSTRHSVATAMLSMDGSSVVFPLIWVSLYNLVYLYIFFLKTDK